MPVYQLGQLNTAGALPPGAYVQVIPPPHIVVGVATNGLGYIGVASWGSVNKPVVIGSPSQSALQIGSPKVRKYDLASACAAAFDTGANNITAVRVTDGTDTAATGVLTAASAADAASIVTAINNGQSGVRSQSTCVVASSAGAVVTITALYTGTVGNTIIAAIGAGTKASSTKVTISLNGQAPETYDNIGTASATAATVTLAGGTDGATGVLDTTLIGVDGATRTGMYALRGTGVQNICLVDHTDSSAWGIMLSTALYEGWFCHAASSAGDSITAASTKLNAAGADDYGLKVLVGDWAYWYDGYNTQTRMIYPAIISAAKRASTAPHISTLNAQINSISDTQTTRANGNYTGANLLQMMNARVDGITNPAPGGNYFAMMTGRNCSSDPAKQQETYTTMTNFLALTLAASYGWVIGKNETPDLMQEVESSLRAFLGGLADPKRPGGAMIGTKDGSPAYRVSVKAKDQPPGVPPGMMFGIVQVVYWNTIFNFIINLEGGSTVNIQTSSSPA